VPHGSRLTAGRPGELGARIRGGARPSCPSSWPPRRIRCPGPSWRRPTSWRGVAVKLAAAVIVPAAWPSCELAAADRARADPGRRAAPRPARAGPRGRRAGRARRAGAAAARARRAARAPAVPSRAILKPGTGTGLAASHLQLGTVLFRADRAERAAVSRSGPVAVEQLGRLDTGAATRLTLCWPGIAADPEPKRAPGQARPARWLLRGLVPAWVPLGLAADAHRSRLDSG
jgi:hypothetical protein